MSSVDTFLAKTHVQATAIAQKGTVYVIQAEEESIVRCSAQNHAHLAQLMTQTPAQCAKVKTKKSATTGTVSAKKGTSRTVSIVNRFAIIYAMDAQTVPQQYALNA